MAHRDYFWDRSGRRIKRAPKTVQTPRLTHGGGGVFGGTGGTVTPPGGGAQTPSSWVEWYSDGSTTGQSYTASTDIDWSAGGGAVTHGSAIILNGAKNAQVAEDGWYAVTAYAELQNDSPPSTWTRAFGSLTVNRTYSVGGDTQHTVYLFDDSAPSERTNNPGSFLFDFTHTWVGYLKAGDTVVVEVSMGAAANPSDTWSVTDSQFNMEKLPI